MVVAALTSCSSSEDYLEIDSLWLRSAWELDGVIDGWNITEAEPDGFVTYWDESIDGYMATRGFSVSYHRDNATIKPGQMTFGSGGLFALVESTSDCWTLYRVDTNELTYKVTVRFLNGSTEGAYRLHVTYNGKTYSLNAYQKTP